MVCWRGRIGAVTSPPYPAMQHSRTDLLTALGLGAEPALVSIVGGGGKSTLMFRLAERLPGRTVTTTTTRIFAAQRALAPVVCSDEPRELERALADGVSGLLVIGAVEGERARGIAPSLACKMLEHPNVDAVVLEADGSRMLPAKAPAAHEPVVPAETTLLVAVAGIDTLAGDVFEQCHRPELVCQLTGASPDAPLSPEALGLLLSHPEGGMKGAPSGARTAIFVNKVETEAERRAARVAALRALEDERVGRVVIGALHEEANGFEVWLR